MDYDFARDPAGLFSELSYYSISPQEIKYSDTNLPCVALLPTVSEDNSVLASMPANLGWQR